MVAHGGESPTRKANARRHVAHATVRCKEEKTNKMDLVKLKNLIVQLKGFVGNARNDEALNLLIDTIKSHQNFSFLHHDALLLKSRFSFLERGNNIIGERSIEEENKISGSILNLIKKLEEIEIDENENIIIEESQEPKDESALKINLQQWVKILKQEEKEYFDNLLTKGEKNKNTHLFSSKLEQLVVSTLIYGLKIETQGSIKVLADTIESIEELKANLLIELIFDPKTDNGTLMWFIERTKFAILGKNNLRLEMIDFTWGKIIYSYCLSVSDKYSIQIFEKIIDAAINKASNRDYELLYLFFKYFITKLENNVDAIGFLIDKLRKHQEVILQKNDSDVKAKYLDKLSLIINLGVKETKFKQGKVTIFSPKTTLISSEKFPYEFHSMVLPLTNEEFDVLTERTRKVEPIYPFVLSLSNPVNQLKEVVDNVNWKEKNNDFFWDIPTVFEWLFLADCIENHYPWGNKLPNSEIANLSYDENNPPRRLRYSASFHKGKSKYGVIDCCGNTHELAYFEMPDYLERHHLRLMGGCFETNWLNSSCQIIRKFIEKDDWGNDERRNVGLRLIRIDKRFKETRKKIQMEFNNEIKDNRKVSRIGNLIPKMNPTANNTYNGHVD